MRVENTVDDPGNADVDVNPVERIKPVEYAKKAGFLVHRVHNPEVRFDVDRALPNQLVLEPLKLRTVHDHCV